MREYWTKLNGEPLDIDIKVEDWNAIEELLSSLYNSLNKTNFSVSKSEVRFISVLAKDTLNNIITQTAKLNMLFFIIFLLIFATN